MRRLLLPAFAFFLAFPSVAAAQAELTGTYVRYFAVGANGRFVSSATRSMQYTETGTTPYSCDAFYPGSPVEGFSIEGIGGTTAFAVSNNQTRSDVVTTSGPTVSGRSITWRGSYASGSASFSLDQVARYEASDRSVNVRVTLTNTGSAALTDLYYMRDADPDFASCSIGTAYETADDVRRQPPGHTSALVTARAGSPSLVLGVGSRDSRARVHAGGFENTDPSLIWGAPTDPAGALNDESIDVVFRETSVPVGGSTTFEWSYVWGTSESQIETRFDAATACTGEGTTCTSGGMTGTCHSSRCCTGCWDGFACQAGTDVLGCGARGAACTLCDDGNFCTSDACSAGACSYPAAPSGTPCEDGLWCTEVDSCSAGTCRGSARICDDGDACTTDRCDEAFASCSFVRDRCMPDGGMTVRDGGVTLPRDGGGTTTGDGGGVVSMRDGGVVATGDASAPPPPLGGHGRRRGGCQSAGDTGGFSPFALALALVLLLAVRRRARAR